MSKGRAQKKIASASMPDVDPVRLLRNSVELLAMTAGQREKALARAHALKRFRQSRGKLSIEEAAREAGMAASTFYQLAARWRAKPGIESLGVHLRRTASRQRISPELERDISSKVVDILRSEGGLSTAEIVRRLVASQELSHFPSMVTLRKYVDDAARTHGPRPTGRHIACDCSALSLVDVDGRSYTGFFIIDRATRLIVGHALGTLEESRKAYRQAARQALKKLRPLIGSPERYPHWCSLSVAPGSDRPAIDAMVKAIEVRTTVDEVTVGRATKKYGYVLRRDVGEHLGTIEFLFRQTGKGGLAAPKWGRYPEDAAGIRLSAAVEEHNRALDEDMSEWAGEMAWGLSAIADDYSLLGQDALRQPKKPTTRGAKARRSSSGSEKA